MVWWDQRQLSDWLVGLGIKLSVFGKWLCGIESEGAWALANSVAINYTQDNLTSVPVGIEATYTASRGGGGDEVEKNQSQIHIPMRFPSPASRLWAFNKKILLFIRISYFFSFRHITIHIPNLWVDWTGDWDHIRGRSWSKLWEETNPWRIPR